MFIAIPPHDHCVYQLLARDGQVIYVGSSSAIFNRLGQHAKTKDWWSHVAAIEVEAFATKEEMLDREQELIRMIDPIHNDTYGTRAALESAADLLGYAVTREDVRQYVAGRLVRTAVQQDPQGVSLRDFAAQEGLDLAWLRRQIERRPEAPDAISDGPNRTRLYDHGELRTFVAMRSQDQDVS